MQVPSAQAGQVANAEDSQETLDRIATQQFRKRNAA